MTLLKLFSAALVTAVVTLLLAYGMSALSGQNDLAARVDRNARVTRAGVDAIICILQIEPEARSDDNVEQCLISSGYIGG